MKEKEPNPKELPKVEEELLVEEVGKEKKEDYESLWDKYVRLCAEFDNARKRWEKERIETVKFANFFLLRDILVVLDEMEQALKMIKKNDDIPEISRGLGMIYHNFVEILKKKGLKVIEAKNKKFNPHFHEIVAKMEVGDDEEHLVLEEIQKGYLIEDRVLRTSKVMVGIRKQPEAEKLKDA